MKNKIFILGAMLLTAFVLQDCGKEKTQILETITSAEDNSTAENEFTAAFDLGDDVASTDLRLKKKGSTILPSGALLTITDSSFTDGDGKEFNIDFGPLGSKMPFGKLCGDGRYRSGKIHFTLSAPYLSLGSILTISIAESDLFFGGNGAEMTQISGQKVITRTKDKELTISVTFGKATNSNGSVSWSANRVITKIMDPGPGLLGDVFEISGSASGINRNGEAFTVNIDLPLKKKIELGCAQTFIKGKLTLKNTSKNSQISVDYDPFNNEACDRTAKATINGKDHFFTVR